MERKIEAQTVLQKEGKPLLPAATAYASMRLDNPGTEGQENRQQGDMS
jgi:hypothetical protein